MTLKNIIFYNTNNREPVTEWIEFLDKTTRARIFVRLDRLRNGSYGDHKRFKGIVELRLHFGKGYRVYFGEDGKDIVLLLTSGDKSSQKKDIAKALVYWEVYNEKK
jgi:putative addiction module killer protein